MDSQISNRDYTQQLVLDEIHPLVKRELQPHDNGKSGGIRLITNQNMRVFGDLSGVHWRLSVG